jgi:hypothetical protein
VGGVFWLSRFLEKADICGHRLRQALQARQHILGRLKDTCGEAIKLKPSRKAKIIQQAELPGRSIEVFGRGRDPLSCRVNEGRWRPGK